AAVERDRYGYVSHPGGMSIEGFNFATRRQVPDLEGVVATRGDREPAVGRDRHTVHVAGMAFEGAHQRRGRAARPDPLAQIGPPLRLELRLRSPLHLRDPQLEALVAKLLQKEPRLLFRFPPAQPMGLPIQRADELLESPL